MIGGLTYLSRGTGHVTGLELQYIRGFVVENIVEVTLETVQKTRSKTNLSPNCE